MTQNPWPAHQRIAILNWRDGSHPQAGGAETYCLAVARWLAAAGAQVTLVTARAEGQAKRSVEDGVEIHRGGGRFGVYLYVFLWLLRRRPLRLIGRRAGVDAVLDCQNGIPFFSPLAVGRRVPVVMLMHHVHQEQFEQHFGARLAGIGKFLEGPASRRVYARTPVVTVSPSTRAEVRRQLRFRNPIYVVPNGGPAEQPLGRTPARTPTLITVGRLVVQKQVDQLLDAVARARRVYPDLLLHVVGVGEELENLRAQATALDLNANVRFHGRVSDAQRDALLDESWLFLSASQREGWGVAVLEAAGHGVPALVNDVPGLRDAVRDGATGWLVPEAVRFDDALVAAIEHLSESAEQRAMGDRCQAWARNFSWDRTAKRVSDILAHESGRIAAGRPLRPTMDLVTRVEFDLTSGAGARVYPLLRSERLTDEWRWTQDRLVGLLYGTDEQGAAMALARMGLSSRAEVSIARSHDLLGDVPQRRADALEALGG